MANWIVSTEYYALDTRASWLGSQSEHIGRMPDIPQLLFTHSSGAGRTRNKAISRHKLPTINNRMVGTLWPVHFAFQLFTVRQATFKQTNGYPMAGQPLIPTWYVQIGMWVRKVICRVCDLMVQMRLPQASDSLTIQRVRQHEAKHQSNAGESSVSARVVRVSAGVSSQETPNIQ